MANQPITTLTQSIPSGYVIGRSSTGAGSAELIPIADISSSTLAQKGRMYQASFSWPGGVPGNSQLIGDHCVSIGVTFPPNFAAYQNHASQAGGSANATGSTVFNVDMATTGTGSYTTFGTITFAAGTITPTFATSSGIAQRIPQGSLLRIIGPSTADATFANPYFTLVGYES